MFKNLSPAQKIKLAAMLLAIANTGLTVGATLTGVPESFKWLTPLWPFIYGLCIVIHQAASVFGVQPDAQVTAALERARAAGTLPAAPADLQLPLFPQSNQPKSTSNE